MSRQIKTEIARGGWVLQQLLVDAEVEQQTARRMLADACRSWPGDAAQQWPEWVVESAASLGLRGKVVECTPAEALALVGDGSQLVLRQPGPDSQWISVSSGPGRRYLVAAAGQVESTTGPESWRQLRERFEAAASDGRLRCVALESRSVGASSSGPRLSPLTRLKMLLAPEKADLGIVTLFAFVVGLLMLATPIAVEALVNTVAFGRFLQPILLLAAILLTFLGFQAAVRALQTFVVEIVQRRLFARIAADLAQRLPGTTAEAGDDRHMPELVNRFFDVVTVQKAVAQLLLDGIGLIVSTAIGLAVLGFYHPWLLGFDVLLLGSIGFIIFAMGRGAVASAVKESKHKYQMGAWLEDIARCPATFRTDGGAELAMERADRLVQQYLTARQSHFRILMRQIVFALTLQAVASTVLLGLGGWLVVAGELTLGQLVAAELIVTVIVGSFAKFGKHMESFYDLLAAVDKLGALIDLPVERQHGALNFDQDGPVRLDLSHVAYSRPGMPLVLDMVSAQVPAGSSFAVAGPSSSGKSLLLDLIAGQREPTAGHLVLNGMDPRDLRPDALAARAALVRGGEVFQGTIEENVHLHRPDISNAEVREALQAVGLLDAVSKLAKSGKTELSSGGAPLSEGQCRLLAIARGIVGRPGLLAIDGGLDALSDPELELILQCLLAKDRPWTLVVATGKEAIAKRCDVRVELPATKSPVA